MNVFVGCEFSGEVRRAMLAAGHFAMSCDLEPAEDGAVWPYHYMGDMLE